MRKRFKLTRPPVKQRSIVSSLRKRIVDGTVGPGGRLPTRDELCREFSVSRVTAQRAIEHLMRDGFAIPRGSRGTFVVERPPHLSRYALSFASHPPDGASWGRFSQTLLNEANAIDRDADNERRVACFFDVRNQPDCEDFQTLVRDVHARRVAGLIFTTNPLELVGTPLLDEPGIPRVAIMSAMPDVPFPRVKVDGAGFLNLAVDYLADRGRKRIAILLKSAAHRPANDRDNQEEIFLAAVQRRGLAHETYWLQFVDVFDGRAVCRAAHLLMNPNQTTRPDGLIIADDTMLDTAIAGLMAAGVRVPQDVEVVAHANFPTTTASAVPVTRLGFDARRVLEVCTGLIDAQRRGEPVPEMTVVPAEFR